MEKAAEELYYNWLNFPVNLQQRTYSLHCLRHYNWLNFPVNLQRTCDSPEGSIYYNWLNFPVNLQQQRGLLWYTLIITD